MVLTIDGEYKVKSGPLNTFEVTFTRSTKKGYNFIMSDGTKLLKQHIYPDKNCVVKGDYMVFWLPAMYTVVDNTAITVSDFSFQNYIINWKKNEENEYKRC